MNMLKLFLLIGILILLIVCCLYLKKVEQFDNNDNFNLISIKRKI